MQNRKVVIALSVAAAIVLFIYVRSHEVPPKQEVISSDANPPLGVPVAVELRPPLPAGLSSLYIKGKLRLVNDRWLVLYNDERPAEGDTWIARESVLLIVTGDAAKTYSGVHFTPNL